MTNWLRRNRRSPWYPRAAGLLICVGVFAGVYLLRSAGRLESLELRTYDLLCGFQTKDATYASELVLLGVTDADITPPDPGIKPIGYPVPDATMAELLKRVLAGNPRAVGLDIYRDLPQGEGREALLEQLKDPRVVSVMLLGNGSEIIGATPGLKGPQMGFANFPHDDDGRIRRAQLFMVLPDGKQVRALAVRLAARYLDSIDRNIKLARVPGKSDEWFTLGKATYRALRPDDGAYVNADVSGDHILFDFRGPQHYTPRSVGEVLRGEVGPEAFAGKVVVIGMTSETVKDFLETGVAPKQYGPEVHLILTEQLIRAALTGRGPPAMWPNWAETGWGLVWTFAGGLLGFSIRRPIPFVVVATAVLCAFAYAHLKVFDLGLWLPAVPALLGCAAAAGFVAQYMRHHERSERAMLNDLFNRIVDEDVAKTIWARRDELLDDGQLAAKELRATVLFTDLEGFTTITEAMDKVCLMKFLNDYMTAMSDVVGHKPDAFVNKYIGDAIMAVFGPPLERSEAHARADARNAVECALEMRARLAEHRARWERECSDGIRKKLDAGETPGAVPPWAAGARPPEVFVRMRIGIQSGMVTAGSVGSSRRMEYTVIGDTVNTAARLESFDKELMAPDIAAGGCRILIGQDTLDLLPPGEYLTREVGSIQLKGKEQNVTIHGVIGRATEFAAAVSTSSAPTGATVEEVQV